MGGDDDDGADDDTFDFGAWWPERREYGLFHLLLCRSAMLEDAGSSVSEAPPQVAQLRFADSRVIGLATAPVRRDPFSSDDEAELSEGERDAQIGPTAWPGKDGSWWRVHSSLGEEVIVREGVQLNSAEVRRIAPGDLVQQAGSAKAFLSGHAKGCVRTPIQPNGWVTADASKAGGPKYLVRASAPRWRVVFSAAKETDAGDAIVREDPTLDSPSVAVLHQGDIVEQAGPSLVRSDGIVRMPVTSTVIRRGEAESMNGDLSASAAAAKGKPAKMLGWVTVDATAKGGPVFFKPVADSDKDKRRRRPRQQWS
eukprot:TRINITY_DN35674_c0_g1_i1.p1 TRINITY_DN35674_c0_g1~~TRINITY_DN35674_c0_g1_i1.p1  ORF type:complete len:311 (-),score=71.32 TRINITY_DN35674_c0_g1_i1:188-1120(-)